mmetsp:Transcript_41680/g.99913  ORF Transcript_41680/g.99913 Transcript_41680/m.99913 type:complete len:288 (+) Transcript_41680:34-897(+)
MPSSVEVLQSLASSPIVRGGSFDIVRGNVEPRSRGTSGGGSQRSVNSERAVFRYASDSVANWSAAQQEAEDALNFHTATVSAQLQAEIDALTLTAGSLCSDVVLDSLRRAASAGVSNLDELETAAMDQLSRTMQQQQDQQRQQVAQQCSRQSRDILALQRTLVQAEADFVQANNDVQRAEAEVSQLRAELAAEKKEAGENAEMEAELLRERDALRQAIAEECAADRQDAAVQESEELHEKLAQLTTTLWQEQQANDEFLEQLKPVEREVEDLQQLASTLRQLYWTNT